jgi:hypothetical protein
MVFSSATSYRRFAWCNAARGRPCYGNGGIDGVIEWPKTGGLISKTLKAKPNSPLHKALRAVDRYFFWV